MDKRLKGFCDSNTFYEKAWTNMLIQLTTSEYKLILPKLFGYDPGLYVNDLGIEKTRVFMEYWLQYSKNIELIYNALCDLKSNPSAPEILCIFTFLKNHNNTDLDKFKISQNPNIVVIKSLIENNRDDICEHVNSVLNSLFIKNWDLNLCTIINPYICFEIPENVT
jgi:hypothetical protein